MRTLFVLCVTFLLIACAVFADTAVCYAVSGAGLFMRSVFPALFPFLVLMNCLRRLGALNGRPFGMKSVFMRAMCLFLIAALAGAPSGSIMANSLCVHVNDDDRHFAVRSILSAFLNFSSPAFILGTVCSRMLGLTSFAHISLLLVSHYGAGLILFAVYSLINRKLLFGNNYVLQGSADSISGYGESCLSVLPGAVYDAVSAMLRIGGSIVFCSVVSGFIIESGALHKLAAPVSAASIGLIEITAGIGMLSGLMVSLRIKLALISFLVSFGGFCIMLQVMSIVRTKPVEYFFAKLFFALVSSAVCYLLFPLFFSGTQAVFGSTALVLASRAAASMEIALVCVLCSGAAMLLAVFYTRKTRI